LPPNKRFQPTPLRVDKIGAIFGSWFLLDGFPFYQCGAAEAQGVRQP
jgi:hypothetical protein